MPLRDKNGKITYQMISPGEAWMNYVDSRQGMNAAAVTPTYLDDSQNYSKTDIEKKIDAAVGRRLKEYDEAKNKEILEKGKDGQSKKGQIGMERE